MLDSELLKDARNYISNRSKWNRWKLIDLNWHTVCALGSAVRANDPEHMDAFFMCGLDIEHPTTKFCVEKPNALNYLNKAALQVAREDERVRNDQHMQDEYIVAYNFYTNPNISTAENTYLIIFVNDHLGHEAVLRMFDIAIAMAEEHEQKPQEEEYTWKVNEPKPVLVP